MMPMTPWICSTFYKVDMRTALHWCFVRWLLLSGYLVGDGVVFK